MSIMVSNTVSNMVSNMMSNMVSNMVSNMMCNMASFHTYLLLLHMGDIGRGPIRVRVGNMRAV